MIDYFLQYTSETAAKTALASQLVQDDQGNLIWPSDYCYPGIQFWRNSQDTIDGSGNPIHTYLIGFFILVSLPNIVSALENLGAVQIVIDREKARQRILGAIIKSNVSNTILQDLRFSPVPAGSDYPFGNMQ